MHHYALPCYSFCVIKGFNSIGWFFFHWMEGLSITIQTKTRYVIIESIQIGSCLELRWHIVVCFCPLLYYCVKGGSVEGKGYKFSRIMAEKSLCEIIEGNFNCIIKRLSLPNLQRVLRSDYSELRRNLRNRLSELELSDWNVELDCSPCSWRRFRRWRHCRVRQRPCWSCTLNSDQKTSCAHRMGRCRFCNNLLDFI